MPKHSPVSAWCCSLIPATRQLAQTRPPPVSAADIKALTHYVENGGGLIVMGNQENHNLEINDMNQLLLRFGLQFTNLYTDVKKLVLPKETPIIGGLRWGYYTGNLVLITPNHSAKPRALVLNDLAQKPLKGARDTPGALLAVAEPGHGHMIVVTDAGWLTNDALSDKASEESLWKGRTIGKFFGGWRIGPRRIRAEDNGA